MVREEADGAPKERYRNKESAWKFAEAVGSISAPFTDGCAQAFRQQRLCFLVTKFEGTYFLWNNMFNVLAQMSFLARNGKRNKGVVGLVDTIKIKYIPG